MGRPVLGSYAFNGIGGGSVMNVRAADTFQNVSVIDQYRGQSGLIEELAKSGQIGITISESPGGKVRITYDSIHGLSANDIISTMVVSGVGVTLATTIVNTTVVDTDITWDVELHATTVGYARKPACLRISTGFGGWYQYNFSVTAEVATTGVVAALALFVETSEDTNTHITVFVPTSDPVTISHTGLIKLNSVDRVWLAIKNVDSADDFTIWSGGFGLTRIGG